MNDEKLNMKEMFRYLLAAKGEHQLIKISSFNSYLRNNLKDNLNIFTGIQIEILESFLYVHVIEKNQRKIFEILPGVQPFHAQNMRIKFMNDLDTSKPSEYCLLLLKNVDEALKEKEKMCNLMMKL